MEKFTPDYAITPADTLAETIWDLGISIAQFAENAGIDENELDDILIDDAPITEELAAKIAAATNTAASFWLNLDANYRKTIQ